MTDPGENVPLTDGTTDDDTAAPPPELGDPGKQALDRMKAKVREATVARRTAEAEIERLTAAASAIDPEKIEARVRAELVAEGVKTRAVDRIEVHAAKMSVDPDVARAMLATKADSFIADGQVDDKAIAEALEALVKEKPYLAARAGRFTGSADGGARAATAAPDDMNSIIRKAAGY